jgi:citrate lyase subunit beta/citryl-CoA lyase
MLPRRYRPRRSVLYMPASNARALEKARTLDADALVFDLEDAVAPDQKQAARQYLKAALAKGGYGERETIVRINGRDTQWFADDLDLAAALPVDAVLVPKVDNAADITALAKPIALMNKQLWVMVETPLSVLNLAQIAACAAAPNPAPLAALVLGSNDLAKDMRLEPDAARSPLQPIMTQMVAAARSYGLAALDGVCNAIGEADRLVAECTQGRSFGFDGKTLIHPSQIAAANAAFAPSTQELESAHAIIAAFAAPDNHAAAVIKVGGKMVERLHLAQAEHLVAEAQMIARRANLG